MMEVYVVWSVVYVMQGFFVCSTGGLILDYAVDKYHGIAVFSPVMNGVGGNLVAVQASRLSTGLHQLGKPGQVQEKSKFRGCIDTFFGSGMVLFSSFTGCDCIVARDRNGRASKGLEVPCEMLTQPQHRDPLQIL